MENWTLNLVAATRVVVSFAAVTTPITAAKETTRVAEISTKKKSARFRKQLPAFDPELYILNLIIYTAVYLLLFAV